MRVACCATIFNLMLDRQPERYIYAKKVSFRAFIKRRRPDLDVPVVDKLCVELMDDVLTTQSVTETQVSPSRLKEIQQTLDERFGFRAEPDLYNVHENVLNQLIGKMGA